MSLNQTVLRLTKLSHAAEQEVALLGFRHEAPGKSVDLEPGEKYILFRGALKGLGFKLFATNGSGTEKWIKGTGGSWEYHCHVSRTAFGLYAVRKADRFTPTRRVKKNYRAPIPGRSPNDMKKYIKWAMNKLM